MKDKEQYLMILFWQFLKANGSNTIDFFDLLARFADHTANQNLGMNIEQSFRRISDHSKAIHEELKGLGRA